MGAGIKPVFFLTILFFCTFIARIILAPLLPVVEQDLLITHSQAGVFFLMISFGYSISIFCSGFVSSRINHRRTISISIIGTGAVLLFVSFTTTLWNMYIILLFLGLFGGLYLPSGIAVITNLIDQKHWGKAIGIHEQAPALTFILAPIIAEVILMVRLRQVKHREGGDLGHDRCIPGAIGVDLPDYIFGGLSLLFIMIENSRSILCSNISALSI